MTATQKPITHAEKSSARRDAPTIVEASYVSKTVRLTLPLRSVTALRQVAEELRGLATNLEYISRRKDAPGLLLYEARCAAERASRRIAMVKGRGRPAGTSENVCNSHQI